MELHYKKEGSGPVVIIIHGLYGSSDNWRSMGKRLAEKFTVYTIDQRNHGRSPFSPSHTFNDLRDDLADFFNHHSIEKATIIGHSMGGKAAMWFAADYPEKIEKLVIADIAPKNYLEINEGRQYHFHRNILRAMMDIDFTNIKNRNQAEEQLAEKIDDTTITKFLLKSIRYDRKNRTFHWRINVETLYNHLDEIVGGVNRQWFEDRLPIRNYPVIFIKGQKSNYILSEDQTLIKEIYPEVSVIEIPGAGHWLHAEKPKEFMEAVMKCC